jgi:hypothetical protein
VAGEKPVAGDEKNAKAGAEKTVEEIAANIPEACIKESDCDSEKDGAVY